MLLSGLQFTCYVQTCRMVHIIICVSRYNTSRKADTASDREQTETTSSSTSLLFPFFKTINNIKVNSCGEDWTN